MARRDPISPPVRPRDDAASLSAETDHTIGTAFTIGHSTRSLDELVALLHENEVQTLVDVRRIPRSRTNPQFDRPALEAALPARGIAYVHDLRLGGRRGRASGAGIAPSTNAAWQVDAFHHYADWALGTEFAAGLAELLALVREGRRPAIQCAELVWWRCHRRIIADWLLASGARVFHVLGPGQAPLATISPTARVDAAGRVTYPGIA